MRTQGITVSIHTIDVHGKSKIVEIHSAEINHLHQVTVLEILNDKILELIKDFDLSAHSDSLRTDDK